ncbi:MAG: hypothetical protein ABEI31_08590 [Halodesulfurarchaeum sp.]
MLIVDGGERGEQLAAWLRDRFAVQLESTVEDGLAAVTPRVAVCLIDAGFPTEDLADLVGAIGSRSPHAQVALVADDASTLIDRDVPHDDWLAAPLDRGELIQTVATLLRRAIYDATLARYFQQTLAAAALGVKVRSGESEEESRLETVESDIDRLRARLDELGAKLDGDDVAALTRRYQVTSNEETFRPEPSASPRRFGLPESCPGCDMQWGVWYGPQLGAGYERIAAFVWRCTDCGHVIANPDPNFRDIARR